jgi:hypothetical protein
MLLQPLAFLSMLLQPLAFLAMLLLPLVFLAIRVFGDFKEKITLEFNEFQAKTVKNIDDWRIKVGDQDIKISDIMQRICKIRGENVQSINSFIDEIIRNRETIQSLRKDREDMWYKYCEDRWYNYCEDWWYVYYENRWHNGPRNWCEEEDRNVEY